MSCQLSRFMPHLRSLRGFLTALFLGVLPLAPAFGGEKPLSTPRVLGETTRLTEAQRRALSGIEPAVVSRCKGLDYATMQDVLQESRLYILEHHEVKTFKLDIVIKRAMSNVWRGPHLVLMPNPVDVAEVTAIARCEEGVEALFEGLDRPNLVGPIIANESLVESGKRSALSASEKCREATRIAQSCEAILPRSSFIASNLIKEVEEGKITRDALSQRASRARKALEGLQMTRGALSQPASRTMGTLGARQLSGFVTTIAVEGEAVVASRAAAAEGEAVVAARAAAAEGEAVIAARAIAVEGMEAGVAARAIAVEGMEAGVAAMAARDTISAGRTASGGKGPLGILALGSGGLAYAVLAQERKRRQDEEDSERVRDFFASGEMAPQAQVNDERDAQDAIPWAPTVQL